MSRKLIYFNFNGVSECLRYMLHYGGLQFEDERISFQDWFTLKKSIPYGQVPIYEENGKTLNQSMAIARYIASQVGLLPSDPWEQAKLDATALTVADFVKQLKDFYWEPLGAKKEAFKKALDEAIPYYLSRFEKEIKAGNGHFSGKLSWADFILVGAIEGFNLFLDGNVIEDYPAITSLVSEIHSLPGVKEYIAKRKPYVKPVM